MSEAETKSASLGGSDAPIFFYSAKTQFSNAGDALINRELVDLLRKRGRVVAISGGAPSAFIAEVGLREQELVPGKEASLILKALAAGVRGRRAYLVQTPGDMGSGGGVGPALLRAAVTPVLALFGVKIIHVGASLSETSPFKLSLLAWRSRFMQGFGLRDPRSLKTATSSNFKNIHYFPDLAFGLEARPQVSKQTPGVRLALSFRGDQLGQGERDALLSVLNQSLEKLPAIASVKVVVQVDRDLEFARRIVETLARWNPELEHTLSIEGLRTAYAETDIILTNRLHALLLAALSGAAPVAVVDPERNKKVVGLLEGLGLADLVCALTDSDFLARFVPRQEEVRSRFLTVARGERQKIAATLDGILSSRRAKL